MIYMRNGYLAGVVKTLPLTPIGIMSVNGIASNTSLIKIIKIKHKKKVLTQTYKAYLYN